MQIIISKSTIVAAVRKGEQIDLVRSTLFRVGECMTKMGMPQLEEKIWNNFVDKMTNSIMDSSLRKAITTSNSNTSLTIDISDEFIIDTMDISGEAIVAAMKLIATIQKQATKEVVSYSEKWITVPSKKVVEE